jgi:alpha-L-fucosidase
VDIVSKNGNLLLNVVQRPDGSLDPEVEQMLKEMADWNDIHQEAIYGTRPWLVYGEGAVKFKGGSFKEDFAYSAKEIRFTTKGGTLYAISLGWPEDGRLVIRSLARPANEKINQIQNVSLLGYTGQLTWNQTTNGLIVNLPGQKPSVYTCGLKITGSDLKPVEIPVVIEPVRANARGEFRLAPDDAELHGDQLKPENQGGQPNIGFWDKGNEWVSWKVQFDQPGVFKVSTACASMQPGAEFVLEAAGQQLTGRPPQTSGWADFRNLDLGQIEIKQPGLQEVKVRSRDPRTWKAINLRAIKFSRTN